MNHRHDVINQSMFKHWVLTNTVMCNIWTLTTKHCGFASCDANSDATNCKEALRKLTAKLGVLQANMNITLAVSDTDSEHNPAFHVTSESRDTAVIYHMSHTTSSPELCSLSCRMRWHESWTIQRARNHAAGERPSPNDPQQAQLSEEGRHGWQILLPYRYK